MPWVRPPEPGDELHVDGLVPEVVLAARPLVALLPPELPHHVLLEVGHLRLSYVFWGLKCIVIFTCPWNAHVARAAMRKKPARANFAELDHKVLLLPIVNTYTLLTGGRVDAI